MTRDPGKSRISHAVAFGETHAAGFVGLDFGAAEAAMLHQAELHDGRLWIPAGFMPLPRRLVMVTGASGMVQGDIGKHRFLTLAYHDPGFRPPIDGETRWLDVQGDDLMDRGWQVEFWTMPIALPGRPA